jgi:hypothetical protein
MHTSLQMAFTIDIAKALFWLSALAEYLGCVLSPLFLRHVLQGNIRGLLASNREGYHAAPVMMRT